MLPGARLSYDDEESTSTKWVVIFIALSLLAHAIIFLIIILASIFIPAPPPVVVPPEAPTVSLSLQAPPQTVPQPKLFLPSKHQDNAPHKETQVESDNDAQLASNSKTTRDPNSIMPDVVSPNQHTSQLENTPNVQAKPHPETAPTPPTPKTVEKPPDKPQTQTAQTPQPQPAKPTDQPPKPAPPKPPTPPVPQQLVDENGLPLLPSINAPTLAPQSAPAPTPVATPQPSVQSVASSVSGRAGMSGAPTPEAMATELGKYKARFYAAVGSHWYPKVDNQISLIGVGMVRIQYTIHYDGTITTKVLQGGNGSTMILQTISVESIRAVSPFIPFSDAMRKQVGDDYTDDFSFSIYGG